MDNVVRKSKEQEREEVDKLFIPINTVKKKEENDIKEFWYEVLSEDEWYKKMGIAR